MTMMRKPRGSEKGFTLVELIITALISGLLMTVVAGLFLGSFKGWIFNYSALIAQQRTRIYRDALNRNVRQARASTVEVSRFNNAQPPRSMLTFTDAAGKNWAFYQQNNSLRMGQWALSGTNRIITSHNVTMPDKVERLIFFYPDIKDLSHLNYVINLEWVLLADNKMKPVTIQMVGEIDIRDQ